MLQNWNRLDRRLSAMFVGSTMKRLSRSRYQIDDCLVITAETLASREAIRLAIQMGISKVIMECDSQIAIDSIIGQSQATKMIRHLVENIRSLAKYFIHGNSQTR